VPLPDCQTEPGKSRITDTDSWHPHRRASREDAKTLRFKVGIRIFGRGCQLLTINYQLLTDY
jgi:hypothetical protein